MRELGVDAFVRGPGWPEEPGEHRLRPPPLRVAHPGDRRQLAIVVRQPAGEPIGHDQMQVGAALGGPQVRGITQVVADIERQPCRWRPSATGLDTTDSYKSGWR